MAPVVPTCSPLTPRAPRPPGNPPVCLRAVLSDRNNISSLFGTAAPSEGPAPDEEEDDQPGVMDGLKSLLPVSVQDADPPGTAAVSGVCHSPSHSQRAIPVRFRL